MPYRLIALALVLVTCLPAFAAGNEHIVKAVQVIGSELTAVIKHQSIQDRQIADLEEKLERLEAKIRLK